VIEDFQSTVGALSPKFMSPTDSLVKPALVKPALVKPAPDVVILSIRELLPQPKQQIK
jgi:hypothetical protein